MDLKLHDIVEMKKEHPCGSRRWEVLRVGMDLKLRCCGCGHEVMAPPPKAGEKYQTHNYRGGIDMRPKWTRYLAMGVALLLAVLMLATLIVPYLSL